MFTTYAPAPVPRLILEPIVVHQSKGLPTSDRLVNPLTQLSKNWSSRFFLNYKLKPVSNHTRLFTVSECISKGEINPMCGLM